jgi:hypothetical protein
MKYKSISFYVEFAIRLFSLDKVGSMMRVRHFAGDLCVFFMQYVVRHLISIHEPIFFVFPYPGMSQPLSFVDQEQAAAAPPSPPIAVVDNGKFQI